MYPTAASASANYDSGGEIVLPYISDTTNRYLVVATCMAMTSTTAGLAGVYGGVGTFGSAITRRSPPSGSTT